MQDTHTAKRHYEKAPQIKPQDQVRQILFIPFEVYMFAAGVQYHDNRPQRSRASAADIYYKLMLQGLEETTGMLKKVKGKKAETAAWATAPTWVVLADTTNHNKGKQVNMPMPKKTQEKVVAALHQFNTMAKEYDLPQAPFLLDFMVALMVLAVRTQKLTDEILQSN